MSDRELLQEIENAEQRKNNYLYVHTVEAGKIDKFKEISVEKNEEEEIK